MIKNFTHDDRLSHKRGHVISYNLFGVIVSIPCFSDIFELLTAPITFGEFVAVPYTFDDVELSKLLKSGRYRVVDYLIYKVTTKNKHNGPENNIPVCVLQYSEVTE